MDPCLGLVGRELHNRCTSGDPRMIVTTRLPWCLSVCAGATLATALLGEPEASEAAHHQHAERQHQGHPGTPRGDRFKAIV